MTSRAQEPPAPAEAEPTAAAPAETPPAAPSPAAPQAPDSPDQPAAEQPEPESPKSQEEKPAEQKSEAPEPEPTRPDQPADQPPADAPGDPADPQPAAAPPAAAEVAVPKLSDLADLTAFLDGALAVQLKDKHIAGATVSVVSDGQIVFTKGYGYADVAARKPVDPIATMFRIGSVSKLFTWTAVMQLVEQGQLDLDADVNQYLKDFKLPANFAQPVTLKHLLTHTPGFEDHVIGLFARSADKLEPLGELLARDFPQRVRPPGELASYSNHGTALAGYIVQVVSGVPWEDYIEQRILQPLGMQHTTVRQPPEDQLPVDMSRGYKYTAGRFKAEGFEYVPAAPAGSMASSAGDMARFMIAHLQDGRYESARILSEASARRMRELLFTHDPRLEGMAYGFMRARYNGHVSVEHGGDTILFHTNCVLLPGANAGLFVSYNTDTGGSGRGPLTEAFLDRYFPPAEAKAGAPLADFAQRAGRYTGTYGSLRRSYTTPAAVGGLLSTVKVSADGDELLVAGGGGTRRFVEIEPRVFREVDGQDLLAFHEDDSGRITRLYFDGSPVAMVRVPWYDRPSFNYWLLGVSLVTLLTAVVGWPLAAFIARRPRRAEYDDEPDGPTTGSRVASWLGWLACLAMLGWVVALVVALPEPFEIGFGMPPLAATVLRWSRLLLGVPGLLALGALVAWLNGYWRFSARLHYTCVLLAAAALVWFLYHWNLLGWA